ncbi:MAG: imidazole glycerol phosphate synthase subunit HisH [Fimbriimonadia bacterium]|nr:imidazole glycerol phosphate synthase subunit HisH [Fimbriimonadia bacterium]
MKTPLPIAIIDYGMGNLRSAQKAFEHLGASARIVSQPSELAHAQALVLPGVGAFGAAMRSLRKSGLAEILVEAVQSGKPFLGICLGLQLLFETSDESSEETGLGLLKGKVIGFRSQPQFSLPVPHMGWNRLRFRPDCPLMRGLAPSDYVYFVHSYYPHVEDESLICAEADYGGWFPCAVHRENLFATQFHPEKSGETGLRLLKNWLDLIE